MSEQNKVSYFQPKVGNNTRPAIRTDLTDIGVVWTRVGLYIPNGISFDQWIEIGERLSEIEQSTAWCIGDWWAYGEHKYGERIDVLRSDEWRGPKFGHCANAGMVCRAFETSLRSEVLSFSHHKAVTAIKDIAEREDLLRVAEINNWSVRELRDEIKRRSKERIRELPSVSTIYDVIVIDPPWPMEKIDRDVRPNQNQVNNEIAFDYPTMGEEELETFWANTIHHSVAQDCHLFCWTTHKFLPMALRLIEKWGFRYVCTMVWHKPGGFQPIGLPQYNCEFVIYARCGAPSFVDTTDFFTCFNAPRREHSRKPDEFYDLVRRVTDGNRIDVFSREARDGFDQLGNETEKF